MHTQILNYLQSLEPLKRKDLETLHQHFLNWMPKCKVWFEDGLNSEGKVVSNPNIGYGAYEIKYANGSTREFFQIGLSANTGGISVYVMGLKDKAYLRDNFATKLGKVKVSGYCIKFKQVKDLDLKVLKKVVEYRQSTE